MDTHNFAMLPHPEVAVVTTYMEAMMTMTATLKVTVEAMGVAVAAADVVVAEFEKDRIPTAGLARDQAMSAMTV